MIEPKPPTIKSLAGLLLIRWLVPLWILTGAIFKLIENSPRLLPRGILSDADRLGLDLQFVLALLISLEFLAIAVMIFIRPLARATAVFMLACFCVVLIREILAGNTSCGCLGSNSPSPWTMLAIDGAMLAGVIFLRPRPMPKIDTSRWAPVVAAALVVAAAGVTFGRIKPSGIRKPAPFSPPAISVIPAIPAIPDETAAAPVRPEPLALPTTWFASDVESWPGRRWTDLELFRYMPEWPRDISRGLKYVVFYSRTCEHCESMFVRDFAEDPSLAARVTAVEIPISRTRLRGDNPWPMPETACELMSLPLRTDWIISPPLALRIEDGVVRCATEGEHTTCLGLPGDLETD